MLMEWLSGLRIRTTFEAFVVVFSPLVAFILLLVLITFAREAAEKAIKKREKSRRAYVLEHSSLVPRLGVLNNQYEPLFNWQIEDNYCFDRSLNSKQQFDYFDYSNYLTTCLSENPEHWVRVIKELGDNKAIYEKYTGDCALALASSNVPDDLPRGLFQSKQDYLSLERAVLQERKLTPATEMTFEVHWSYTSPQGRNSYSDRRFFTPNDVARMLTECRKSERYREGADYQRSLVTPGLRFDVMRRDGFKCCLCGRSANDGVKLEVDHIIPVSRGGKTVMSNLQTLCWDCNRGKSNKM